MLRKLSSTSQRNYSYSSLILEKYISLKLQTTTRSSTSFPKKFVRSAVEKCSKEKMEYKTATNIVIY